MFGSTVLDLGIGLIFVFFLVSLVCSAISEQVSRWLNMRAEHLEKWLRDLIMEGDGTLVEKLYASPVIQSLVPQGTKPTWISAQTFMLAVFDAFVPGASGKTTVDQLLAAVQGMDDSSPMKKTLLSLITASDNKIDGLRSNFENWYNAAEQVMTSVYRHRMWQFSLGIGLAVAILFNVDAIAVGTSLWRDSALRSSVAAAAYDYTKQAIQSSDPLVTQQNAQKAIQSLNALNLPIGWQFAPFAPVDWVQSSQTFTLLTGFLKLVGWTITGFAGAQGAPFWFDLLRKATGK
jgi:hypothetical protein